jgi:hypothetical protein
MHVGADEDSTPRLRLKDTGLDLIETELSQLQLRRDGPELLSQEGVPRVLDVFYRPLGCSPESGLQPWARLWMRIMRCV